MDEYDVIIIGGGVNGLTAASYLGKAGLKILVLEARGECGTHSDTCEPGIPGFLHNTHATWIISAMSPAMEDLDLETFGLEYRTTEYAFGKVFADGKNALMGVNPVGTMNSWKKFSAMDCENLMRAGEYLFTNMEKTKQVLHEFLNLPPSETIRKKITEFADEIISASGVDLTFDRIWEMNGFELTDAVYESEHIKTLIQAFGWIGGLPPIHPTVGSIGACIFGPLSGPVFPVHQCKGGSHALSHALVKAATANGVTILPCCPVERIVIEGGEARGAVLSDRAVFPKEAFRAKKIISNLSLIPTFLDLLGEDVIGAEMAERIGRFDYSEQNLFCMNFALSGAPRFRSADFDDGIQRCFMGYFGGDDSKAFEAFNRDLVGGVIHETPMANWFVPTLADPTQAPEGCHTAVIWQDVPPEPKSWRNGPLKGMESWDEIKIEMADIITDEFEKYAPGFKSLIIERVLYTPLDIERNNPSAILGNWVGGSVIPDQFFMNRPVKGVLRGGGSRTFLPNLYLSNSIHPFGATFLSSGYMAACEVAEDLGARDQSWWRSRSFDWYLDHIDSIPQNLGVDK